MPRTLLRNTPSVMVGGFAAITLQASRLPGTHIFKEPTDAFKWDANVLKYVHEVLQVEGAEDFVLLFSSPEMVEDGPG